MHYCKILSSRDTQTLKTSAAASDISSRTTMTWQLYNINICNGLLHSLINFYVSQLNAILSTSFFKDGFLKQKQLCHKQTNH